jgi:hypothetical protein
MNIFNSLANPIEHISNLLIFESSLALHIIKKRSLRCIFKDQMNKVPFSYDFIQIDNILVIQLRMNLDFLFNILELFLLEFGFIDLG